MQIPINPTTGTSTDTSEIYTAQWDQLMIGIRTSFNLQFLRERRDADPRWWRPRSASGL